MSKQYIIDPEKPRQIIENHLSELLRVKARAILREALELERECNLSMEFLNTGSPTK